ncbi:MULTISPECIES: divalent-cation tolerance protein CutA [Streptomyces]|uniref:divalent-cation tolerance protein CutA n=1 Tax=Streptomyces TaxID=1883 RepID=UPI002248F6B4|nr:divalent-cation tolerance protein CutA [Streptomyces sp. JHD 1]MCX2971701.1 divalent-cation tolerance protein CutA [Streptomyces sp. JHD 1]
MTQLLTVLTTTDSAEAARALAAGAVERRVAACAQVAGPITSVYRWQGRVREDPEWQLLLATTRERYPALAAYLREAHAYDVPEIIATPVAEADADYARWVAEETEGAGEADAPGEAGGR